MALHAGTCCVSAPKGSVKFVNAIYFRILLVTWVLLSRSRLVGCVSSAGGGAFSHKINIIFSRTERNYFTREAF